MVQMKVKGVDCTLEAGTWKCKDKELLGFLDLYSLLADERDPSHYGDEDIKIASQIVKDGVGHVTNYVKPAVMTGEDVTL